MSTTATPYERARPPHPRPHRPGLRSLMIMVRAEATMVARDPAGLITPLGLPVLILLTSASSASQEVITAGRTALDLYVMPLVTVMVLTFIGVLNMPSFLAYYRRSGILRRFAVTPVSPLMVLVAQVIVSILQSLLGIGLALAVAAIVFDVNPPLHLGAALGVLVLCAAAMYSAGMIVAAIAPTPSSAVAIGLVGFLGLGAVGGMFGGRDALPDPVAAIGAHLPFGAGVEALSAAWAGQAVPVGSLLSLAITLVLGIVIAAALFRWD
ncbi:MAG: ABC transporter permease [Actinomycetales bacterium]|nr:ABC transporter permease [Actinomycetales bacterium]